MGRQISVAMCREDEERFLEHLHASAKISLYRSWSPEPEAVDGFSSELSASPFWIHNQAFTWEPSFEKVSYEDQISGEPGLYFRLVTEHAPLIEYSRHPLGASNPQVAGRLYWSKRFMSQPHQLAYSLAEFDAWFGSIAAWVRKHGKKVPHGQAEAWFLPAALRELQNAL